MASVDGITVTEARRIENASIVDANIVNGQLILTTAGGTNIDAGVVVDSGAALGTHESDASTHGVGEIVGRTEGQSLTNKTLVTPTIASFVNAAHTHGNAANGGELAIGMADAPAPVVTLSSVNLADGDPAKNLASLTCTPGRWLILASCEGVTLNASTKARFTYNLTASAPTFKGKPVSQSSDTTAIDGGASLFGWLENSANSTITFTIEKNGAGALVTSSTVGLFIAIRMG